MHKLIQRVSLWFVLFCVFYTNGSSKRISTRESVFENLYSTIQRFDVDGNQALCFDEFTDLCKNLFVDAKQKPYKLENETLQELFNVFNRDGNGLIDKKEFSVCYNEWIKKIVNPVSVLVVVDVQNDFIDGSIALRDAPAGQEGLEVIEPIHKMQETIPFKQIFYTKDWHPDNHISFFENRYLRQLHESSKIKNVEDVRLFDTVVFKGDSGQPWSRNCGPITVLRTRPVLSYIPIYKLYPEARRFSKGCNRILILTLPSWITTKRG